MNNKEVFKIDGLEEIMEALRILPSKVSVKILLDANRDVLKNTLLSDLKSAIPYSSKTRRGIKLVRAKGTKTGYYLGVSTDAFWLRFLQFGTDERYTRTGGSRKKTKRYNQVGRYGSDKGAGRGVITPRETGVVSTIEGRTNAVLEAVTENYSEFVVQALTSRLKKFQVQTMKTKI